MGLRGPESKITRKRLMAALTRSKWVIIEAARILGVSRRTVYVAIQRHAIDLSDAPATRAVALGHRRSVGGLRGALAKHSRTAA